MNDILAPKGTISEMIGTLKHLRAEVERLTEWNREIAVNARELVSENEKLRAALEDIAYPNPVHGEDQLMQIARAALEGK